MPTESAHIQLAVRNQGALDHLCVDPSMYSEWIATVAFYKAVHVVEAVFTHDQHCQHSPDHSARNNLLKQKKYARIWKNFQFLWTSSMIARYLGDTGTGKQYNTFNDYISPNRVVELVVKHWLHQIQQSARSFLSETGCRKLGLRPSPRAKTHKRRKKKRKG